ncbi:MULTISPECIES: hypothetical protein [Acidobacterium]|nr:MULTISPECIES: hypothetical protein [Acidobacterium]
MENTMTVDQLRASLSQSAPPPGLAPLLEALWWEAKGNWHRAHEIAQAIDSRDAARVHAYLHRREGDAGNAAYWYRRAGLPPSHKPLDEEWREIAATLLRSESGPRS